MVKVVQADKAVGSIGLLGKFTYVETRGVGGQDGFLRADLVQLLEEVGLDPPVLENRFDDKVGIGNRVGVGGALDSGDDRVGFIKGKDFALDTFPKRFADGVQAAFHELVLHVHHDDIDPLLGDFLDNAAAHVTGTDHADFSDLRHVTSMGVKT